MSDEPKIEPVMEDDVPYCDVACDSYAAEARHGGYCLIDGEDHHVCIPAVRAMAKRAMEPEGGWAAGVTAFAWWKDGIQYVGTCGTTLKDALAKGAT